MADNASSNDDGLKPLTVDAMLAKYPKPNVDKTVYNRQYTQYFRTLPVLYWSIQYNMKSDSFLQIKKTINREVRKTN